MKNNSFAILINSCDAYSDVWTPFFRVLEKTWPQAREHEIFLNTETKQYKDPFFDVKVLNCLDNKAIYQWGRRLLQAIDRIESDNILFLLEDFFFEEPVRYEEIDKCVKYLNENKDISVFGLTSQMECADASYCELHKDIRFPGYVIRKQKVGFKYNAGPSLWRKSSLKRLIFKRDTPWGWEFFGNFRTWYSSDKIYGRACDYQPVFVYDIIHGGAVHRGKWTEKSVQEVMRKYNVDIDLSIRGIEKEADFNPLGNTPKPVYKRLSSVIKNRLSILFNVLYGFLLR